jgi:anti-anti-sigma factor
MSVSSDLGTVRSADLRITVGNRGTTRTIGLGGTFDVESQAAVRQAIARAVGDQPECVLVDLARLNAIDADGVAVVVDLVRRCRSQQMRLVIVPGPPEVQDAFAAAKPDLAMPFVAAAVL